LLDHTQVAIYDMTTPLHNQFPSISGAGLNYINDFYDGLLHDAAQNIKWLEVRPENYLDRAGLGIRMLDAMREIYPFVGHTVSLSLGSPDPIDWEHLKKIKNFVKRYKIPFLTDHLGTYSYQHTAYQILLPIPFTKAVAEFVAKKAIVVQDFLEIPFGLENLVYTHFPHPPQISEVEFINTVLDKSGCHFLLDINDVYINSRNYQFNPIEFIDNLNLQKLIEIHISGYSQKHPNGLLEGEHAAAITPETFSLLQTLGEKIKLPPLLFEWENSPPPFLTIVEQMKTLNLIWSKSQTP